MGLSISSFLSLNIDTTTFFITKAHIKEDLESLFNITCEGYIENLQKHPFASALHNSTTLNFHPDTLINKQATFVIENPHTTSKENHTLVFNNALTSLKTSNRISQANIEQGKKIYTGVISFVEYLGLNSQSSANVLNRSKESKALSHKHFFTFTLTSPLIRMSLNKANRIYINTTIVEVIQTTLDFHKETLGKKLDFSHIHLSYPKLELITQYQESDLDFITRLAHNNGIYFYEDDYSIYFHDFSQKETTKQISFNPKSNNALNEPCISSFYKQQALKANSFTQSSENALNPFALQSISLKSDFNPQEEYEDSSLMQDFIYNEHNYLSKYSFTHNMDLTIPLSLKDKRTQVLHNCFQAQSNIYDLLLHQQITIDFSQSIKENKENLKDFYIIAIEHLLINEALLANTFNANDELIKKENVFTKNNLNNIAVKDPSNTQTQGINSLDTSALNTAKAYSNLLTLLPITFSYTPSLKNKPKAPHSTLGVVIGKSEDIQGERNTIHTDEYGRVRVRINCFASQEVIDNEMTHKTPQQNPTANNSAHSDTQTKTYSYHYSPYLRVSSPIASASSGFYHTPRIGDEVIISFFDDDIDKPYISGSLYNQSNPSLMHNPLDSHKTSISSKTTGTNEQGLNEITLSNLKDKEQIYLQAQRDYEELIKHNFLQMIHNNKDSQVGGAYNERIKKIHTQTIDLAKIVSIGGEYNTNVALSKDTAIGLSHTLSVGVDNKVKIAKNSSEKIGGDKEVEIRGNLINKTAKDVHNITNGHFNIQSKEEVNILSQSQMNLNAKDNILLTSKQSLSMNLQEYLVAQAKNAIMEVLESLEISSNKFNIESKEEIKLNIGESHIVFAKDGTITISNNGNVITLSDEGISIKGKKITIGKGES